MNESGSIINAGLAVNAQLQLETAALTHTQALEIQALKHENAAILQLFKESIVQKERMQKQTAERAAVQIEEIKSREEKDKLRHEQMELLMQEVLLLKVQLQEKSHHHANEIRQHVNHIAELEQEIETQKKEIRVYVSAFKEVKSISSSQDIIFWSSDGLFKKPYQDYDAHWDLINHYLTTISSPLDALISCVEKTQQELLNLKRLSNE